MNILSIIDNYNCSRVHGLSDIEEISAICGTCSLDLSCHVKYLLQTQRRASKLGLLSGKDHDRRSSNDEKINLSEENLHNGESCIKRTLLRRSILIKKSCNSNDNNKNGDTLAPCCQTKKVVRFADALGLELIKVKTIQNVAESTSMNRTQNGMNNESTRINQRKYYQIRYESSSSSNSGSEEDIYVKHATNAFKNCCRVTKPPIQVKQLPINTFSINNKQLIWNMKFEQACMKPNFFVTLNDKKVQLESLYSSDKWLNGIVRVLNISFEKHVKLRYTVNNWATYQDIDASYINNSCDGLTDRFNFRFSIDSIEDLVERAGTDLFCFKIEFAICYDINSSVFWDNNDNQNYVIECLKVESKPNNQRDCAGNCECRNDDYLNKLD